jgi:flagellar hook-basal body complex protein FliE
MDDLTIQNHLRTLSGTGQLGSTPEFPRMQSLGKPAAAEGTSFKDMLAESIENVNQSMLESDKAVEALASGESANVHGTLIALQKADISFRLLVEVRNKVMRTYEEIMRMQA